MTFRILVFAALLLVPGGSFAKPLPDIPGFEPNLTIYLAKGPANACGQGCDHWIAIEGKVDPGAAARVARFLRGIQDTRLPIYLHSPGGAVEPSYVIGRLLRSRKAIARIGRTVVKGCGADAQVDDACLRIKTAGGEVEAEIDTRHSMCNSACSYLFLGAATREVAPDAAVAVHNSKFTFLVHGHPSAGQIAAFTDKSMARADRERASYIAAMGINRELDALISTVKFENLHILTRPELYRFGVDGREFVETAWTTESAVRSHLRKVAFQKKADGSFRAMEWRLTCENKERARLMFVREFDKDGAGKNSVAVMAGTGKPVALGTSPARIGAFEGWSGILSSDVMKTMLNVQHLQMAEATLLPGGKIDTRIFDIDTTGLEPAWTQLLPACPAAPARVKPLPASPAVVPAPAK